MAKRRKAKGKGNGQGKDQGKPQMKSFRDLAKSMGREGAADQAPGDDRGWTLEGSEAAGEDTAEAHGEGVSARERILSSGASFGPMTSGPACYRDLESEEMELLASFRVRTVFPKGVAAQVAELPKDPGKRDFAGRRDLRGEVVFTIDGEDAKDYDDALSIRKLEGGRVELGVHIADVSHYVQPGTPLDAEAMLRGTSIYLPDQVVAMLPEELSNHLCSLVPDRDRLAFSVFLTFDGKGTRTDAQVEKTVIRSGNRCTYRQVQELLDGKGTQGAKKIAHLGEPLVELQRWARVQQKLRDARGSMRIQSSEQKFVFDAKGEVSAIVEGERFFSMALIEETALAANQAVGDLFLERGLPIIYRVHPEKDPDEIAAVAESLLEHGIRVPKKERLTGRDIARMILVARRRPNARALIQRIMGLVERAVYEVRGAEDVASHFGLARRAYLHFTSPIRRYPDLIVHRWLHETSTHGQEAVRELSADAFLQDLNDIADHASAQSELAEMASRSVGDLKVCQFMHPHIGETLPARVERVMRAGLEVRFDEHEVTGFLPARKLGDRGEVKGATVVFRRGRRALSFTEGHPIRVKLSDVDFIRLELTLELA